MDSNAIQLWLLVIQSLTLIAIVVYVWSSVTLSRYTRALSSLTKELVQIETRREARMALENRREEIQKALDLAQKIVEIPKGRFSVELATYSSDRHPGHVIIQWAQYIRNFSLLTKYLKSDDPETIPCIAYLLHTIDSVFKGGPKVVDQYDEIMVGNLQKRLEGYIYAWREEMKSTT